MNKGNAEVQITYLENINPNIFNEFKQLSKGEINLSVEKRTPGIYGAWEWALPTAIVVYFIKPYFETMLKEAAKDHYSIIKKGAKSLIDKTIRESNKIKLSEKLAIYCELQQERNIKFCLIEGLSSEEYDNQVEKLAELLKDHYNCYPEDKLTKKIKNQCFESHDYYAYFSPKSKEWELIDPYFEAKHAYKKQEQNKKRK